ncbi:threonine aldolase family protein [Enterovirga aerilata]|uniref:threonine aldolase family protein n=1 Tax=Enterovirga aerilata TaxID=2730920 RepID=UPI003211CB77
MIPLNFASDNVAGASRPVLDALVAANAGPMPAYGADPITGRVAEAFVELFEREVEVLLVATGTAANALALSAALSPWGLCLCHEEAHVIDDECGAPEFFSHGAKLLGLPGAGGKIGADAVAAAADALPRHEKQMPAEIVSISQATECGLVYTPDEIAALGEAAHARGLKLHMDGARFANALVSLGAKPAEMTWRRGVDILSFGGTKNGCLAAEAVVVFDPDLAGTLRRRRKRAGHTLSKGRLLAAQFEGYLAQGHWLENARHANAMAARLAAGLAAVPGVRLAWPCEANEVFPILPKRVDAALRTAGAVYHPWSAKSLPAGEAVGPDEVLVRLVTAFDTRPESVEALLAAARQGA